MNLDDDHSSEFFTRYVVLVFYIVLFAKPLFEGQPLALTGFFLLMTWWLWRLILLLSLATWEWATELFQKEQ